MVKDKKTNKLTKKSSDCRCKKRINNVPLNYIVCACRMAAPPKKQGAGFPPGQADNRSNKRLFQIWCPQRNAWIREASDFDPPPPDPGQWNGHPSPPDPGQWNNFPRSGSQWNGPPSNSPRETTAKNPPPATNSSRFAQTWMEGTEDLVRDGFAGE